MPSASSFAVEAIELETAPLISSLIVPKASMK
ncbi:Uncharacterised protein [Vibrio cholerae]|nr:Uncharacterised protein [Vibrio cholerae]